MATDAKTRWRVAATFQSTRTCVLCGICLSWESGIAVGLLFFAGSLW